MLQGGGGDGGDFHSRLFLPLSDNLEEITGLLEGPWWRLPCSSSTGGLKSAPWGPSSRNQPRAEPSACGGVLGHVTPPEDHFQAWQQPPNCSDLHQRRTFSSVASSTTLPFGSCRSWHWC